MQMPISTTNPAPEELSGVDFLADGTLALKNGKGHVEFSFNAYGLNFSCNTRLIETGPILQITAEIGSDPYTAEGAHLRDSAHAIIRASQDAPACRLMVSRQKRIYCVGRARLAEPWTPTALLTAAADHNQEARPYLMIRRDILPKWPQATSAASPLPQ
jgi:hypothetical protein